MKIHQVVKADDLRRKELGAEQSDWITFDAKNINLMKYYVDAPLVEACQDLVRKNIRTWYSHCNTDGQKVEFFKAILGIDASSLSKENLAVLENLMQESPENVHASGWHSNESLGGSKAKVFLEYEFPGDVDTEVVLQHYKNLSNRFAPQEKISNNGYFTRTKKSQIGFSGGSETISAGTSFNEPDRKGG